MSLQDHIIYLILSGITFVGVYQFYFLTQRHHVSNTRIFHSELDEKVPFWPSWVWIYSFLYYPAILYLNVITLNARHFAMMVFSFVALLVLQMFFFYFFPVATPDHWRSRNKGSTASERFLQYVQKFDGPTNCFPSMHVSVATLTALHASGSLGPWAFAFPVLIALSCMFTKQHYMINLPFGAVLGWLAFRIYLLVM